LACDREAVTRADREMASYSVIAGKLNERGFLDVALSFLGNGAASVEPASGWGVSRAWDVALEDNFLLCRSIE